MTTMLSMNQISWQEELANGFKNPQELLDYLGLDAASVNLSEAAHQAFNTRVPRGFAAKMRAGDINDPLLMQVLPISNEMLDIPGYSKDPLLEIGENNPIEGLLHKYPSRVLLTLTRGCAVHCRYCFRRHFDYQNNTPGKSGLPAMLDYIRANPAIKEVILSGGDPLLLPDDSLKIIIEQIAALDSVEILRIHTRMPIVLPSRMTTGLIKILQETRLQTLCVVHCNHPNELDNVIENQMRALAQSGTMVLNQSVLLKGINDDADILCALSYKLLKTGILPYYLHVLDKIAGAAHFDLEEKIACDLHETMRKSLPGYLLPRLVREVPGELSKMSVLAT